MAPRNAAGLAALAAVSAFLAVTAPQAQRDASEMLIARGGFASLAGEGERDGATVYLPPGTRLEPVGSGAGDHDPQYLTETGLVVTLERGSLLGSAEQRAIRSTVGRNIAFVLAHAAAPVRIGDRERLVELVAGTPYRAFLAAENKAVLAVDLCDSFWREIRSCGDAAGLPLVRPVRMGRDEIALFDLDRLKNERMRAPGPMSRLTVAGANGVERGCGATALTLVAAPGTAAPGTSPVADAEPFLARLNIDYETELASANALGPTRAVRFVYAARSDGRPRRLGLVIGCATGRIEQVMFRDARGTEFVIEGAEVQRLGMGLAADHFVAACPRSQVELTRELQGQGLAPEDGAWLLSQIVRWQLDRPCDPPQG